MHSTFIKTQDTYYCLAETMYAVESLPALEDLPLRIGDPPFSAWGMWKKPEFGALNYLTEENTLRSVRECIKSGVRVSLKSVREANCGLH